MTRRKLGGKARKWVLLVHILSAAVWLGVDLALGILVVTSIVVDDRYTAGMAIQAVDVFAIWPMFGSSIVCLVSGVVLGLGTKYGIVRYWWVAVKLVINVVFSMLIYFALRPGMGDAATIGERMVAGDPTASVPLDLLNPVIVAPVLLLTAYLLSVFKPWGKVRKDQKPQTRERVLTAA
jgi:hypothetical protein